MDGQVMLVERVGECDVRELELMSRDDALWRIASALCGANPRELDMIDPQTGRFLSWVVA